MHFYTFENTLTQKKFGKALILCAFLNLKHQKHGASNTKITGSIPSKMHMQCTASVHCKSLQKKASAKCINVHANTQRVNAPKIL